MNIDRVLAPGSHTNQESQARGQLPIRHWIALALICLPALLLRLDTYPVLWFDEGYKLNAVRTLVERGVYGTYTVAGYIPFDPGTSSGPLDTGAMAISSSLFGIGIAPTRLISVLFTLVAIYSLYNIGVYLWGNQAGFFSLLFALAFPLISDTGFLYIGRQILSEPAQLGTMVLGLYIAFRASDDQSIWRGLLAGFIIGAGILSKTQVAIGLLPALVVVALVRGWRERASWRRWLVLLAPTVTILLVYGGWNLVAMISTPADIRRQNSDLLMDAVRSNLLTDLLGRGVSRAAALINTFIILSVGATFYRVLHTHRFRSNQVIAAPPPLTNQRWAEITLALFVFFIAIWHVGLSVGWPRYTYAGLVVALLLLGRTIWGVYQRFSGWERWHLAAFGVLMAAVLTTNLLPIVREPLVTDVQDAAVYIASEIPASAVIETWEWELDALSGHWQMHHPPQEYLFTAIRQYARELPFELDYDPLQMDPDYLILGRMSDWTRIYRQDLLDQEFRLVARFGIYRIFERLR